MEKPSKYLSNSIRVWKQSSLSFSFVSKEEVLAEIKALLYFIIRFQTPRDYFEVNTGRFQISSMRDVSVSTHGWGVETSLS